MLITGRRTFVRVPPLVRRCARGTIPAGSCGVLAVPRYSGRRGTGISAKGGESGISLAGPYVDADSAGRSEGSDATDARSIGRRTAVAMVGVSASSDARSSAVMMICPVLGITELPGPCVLLGDDKSKGGSLV